MHPIRGAVQRALIGPGDGIGMAQADLMNPLARRPYINSRGQSVIAVNTGRYDDKGAPVYREQMVANATLRKDEWVRVDSALLKSFRERLVIVADLQAAGLVYPVGGLGVLISEWEKASEMTDAEVTLDGESEVDNDRQEFGLNGVPIPVIQKRFRIGKRQLMASRTRGAGLDLTAGEEAARAVARTCENIVFNGSSLGAVKSAENTYSISGLLNFSGRATATIADWSLEATTPADILDDILSMVQVMESTKRCYGPFKLYVPADVAFQFRRDFKANGDRTLMDRVLATGVISAVRVSDVLASGNVVMVQMTSDVIDLATAADVTTIQWSSPSGWTEFFQTFTAMAPRLKTDYDGRSGIMHATPGT